MTTAGERATDDTGGTPVTTAGEGAGATGGAGPLAGDTGRPRRPRPSPVDRLLAPAPAARLAALRILVGTYATVWALVRLPAHLDHASQVAARWQPVGILQPFDRPLADGAVVALATLTPLVGLLFVVGWRYRLVGPLFALATLALATLDSSWGQIFHTENLPVVHLLILAVTPAADALVLRGLRPRGRILPTAADERYGWPVRLAAVVVLLTYVLAGVAKLRVGGLDWFGGDTLRHLVAHDNLRKALLGDVYSPLGRDVVAHAWLFPPLAVATLAIELGAVVTLAGGRWRTVWVGAAWLFHVGVLALMAIVFPYQLSGVAFAPFFRLERLAGVGPVRNVVRHRGSRGRADGRGRGPSGPQPSCESG